MIPNTPISPLFKSNLFSLDWYNEHDDVFLEANTNPYSSRSEANSRTFSLFDLARVQDTEARCNLQVVPEIDSTVFDASCERRKDNIPEFTFFVTSPKEKRAQLNDCMFSGALESESKAGTLTLPHGPTRKLSESEIELLKLLSLLFLEKVLSFHFRVPGTAEIVRRICPCTSQKTSPQHQWKPWKVPSKKRFLGFLEF